MNRKKKPNQKKKIEIYLLKLTIFLRKTQSILNLPVTWALMPKSKAIKS
jgi:hypothetical protein